MPESTELAVLGMVNRAGGRLRVRDVRGARYGDALYRAAGGAVSRGWLRLEHDGQGNGYYVLTDAGRARLARMHKG